ncbi:MAG: helix-hairpin-helix domain-containing protein [Salinivirgaceae bacterium]|nr:helix-hairpin-helix domain-containing protein [Salinivirgaceae bacterium]
MKSKMVTKIGLTDSEKQKMRLNKVKIKDIPNYAVDELAVIMGVSLERAKEVYALMEFQVIPSIGIRFAEDLISLGYYSINELKGKDGAKLTEEFELLKGYWIDPCVEDQFRLAVHYAETGDKTKKWWDFTEERKKYRRENGHPPERPQKAWHETLGVKPGNDNGNLYV